MIATAERRDRPALARIWVDRTVKLRVGAPTEGDLRTAVAAVAPLAGSRFPGRVSSVTATPEALTLRLRSGLEIRLGDAVDVPLKLAVAARVIPLLDAGTAVPRRRRARAPGRRNPQLSGRGLRFTLDDTLRFPLTMPTRSPYPGSECRVQHTP